MSFRIEHPELTIAMIKCYPEHSSHRTQLAEAIGIASKIAKCEPNEQTIRATVMYCLERNVDGFPVRHFGKRRLRGL